MTKCHVNWFWFCKLFSETSIGLPALLPWNLQPRQARGTLRKQFTKPTAQVILSLSISNDQIYLCEDGEAEEGLGGEGVGHLAEAEQADEDNQTELHRAASSKSSQIG